MNNNDEVVLEPELLSLVLSRMLNKTIVRADSQLKKLQGGTLGNVQLVTGRAETSEGENLPYKIVWKTQKKFERYGDPGSWRREYDLHTSNFSKIFSESLRLPECYHAEINDDEIQLWLEYIDGVSGVDLTLEMYKRVSEGLGRFQGKLYAEQPDTLRNLTNLSEVDFVRKNYQRYRSWDVLFDYIRSEDCDISAHLCNMLIDFDNNADEIFSKIEQLPVVFCHRDFWIENILYTGNAFVLIDWDTTGWGYLGEDLASLIADEMDLSHMIEAYQKCVPLYYKGLSEYVDLSHINDRFMFEIIVAMFGYRLLESYKFANSPEDKSLYLNTLQKIYELGEL
ncbi:phosphotransferase [Alkalicoccobacillus porphyridii]|uniref:Aminoglycoside phosphotransferase family protein n=1 Tax=Alkalicoccobacillus porphyridii TaxID=2597270 RepID=A0A553ZWR8_9BACI|nr:aminoglycoside phosphotransferase family protein [Alkalicoccobacillus porphyridii]TSB45908.1 aminoglycoside phosphotransferase family protein [Alkalicoccobacillus porphyridii]